MQAIGKVLHVWQRVLVRVCHQIQTAIIATRSPGSIFLWEQCAKEEAHGDLNGEKYRQIPNV